MNCLTGSQRPLGFQIVRIEGVPYLEPDEEELAIMAEIVRLRDNGGLTWQEISDSIEQRLCEYEGREFRQSAFFKRKWDPSKCRRAYFARKRLVQEERPASDRT